MGTGSSASSIAIEAVEVCGGSRASVSVLFRDFWDIIIAVSTTPGLRPTSVRVPSKLSLKHCPLWFLCSAVSMTMTKNKKKKNQH